MKRVITLLTLLLTFFVIGCEDTPADIDTPPTPSFEFDEDTEFDLSVKYSGGKYKYHFTTNTYWSAEASESWVSITPDEGSADDKQFTIVVEKNNKKKARSTTVTVTYGENNEIEIKIDQDPYDEKNDNNDDSEDETEPVFDIDSDGNVIVEAKGGKVVLDVTTNIEYTVNIPTGAQEWLSVADTRAVRKEKLTFTVAENYAEEGRMANVRLLDSNDEELDNFVFKQKGTSTDGGKPGSVKVEVKVAEVEAGGATIEVVTTGISEFAYIAGGEELEEAAILVSGTKKSIEDPAVETTTSIQVYGYEPNTTATVYFAFRKTDNRFYGEVVKAEFTTANYEGTLTVVDRSYDGFAVHVQVPASVKENKNALRFSTTSLPMYNYSKSQGSMEVDMLLYNAQQFTTEDITVRYDEEHSYERDEEGNIIENGAAYSDPKVPGEPGVFLIGEFGYMDDPDELVVYIDGEVSTVSVGEGDPDYLTYLEKSIWSYPAGWQPGYYMPMFDWKTWIEAIDTDSYDTEKYWSGYYERIQVDTLEPEKLDGGVKISTYDLKPISGYVSFEPTDNVEFYNVMIMEESEFQVNVLPLLDNKEEYLRWFTSSYFALYTFGSKVLSGNSEIYLPEWFFDMKGMQGSTIRVLCTSMGNKEGTIQGFDTYTFKMPEVTKPAPEIVVTPVKTALTEMDPYNAYFNIKAPNKDAAEVYFACDYVREFDAALKGTTYLALMKSMGAGNKLAANDISRVNSDEGFEFKVASRADAETRLAVLVYNDEGTNNTNLNDTESSAIAEYTTPKENYPARVNSSLFDELVGEWEASATMIDYNSETQAWEAMKDKYTSTITIKAGVDYPETLPKEVYDLYASMKIDRDKTDELYDEFKQLAEDYNARTRGFNRLLCLGYNFAAKDYMLDMVAEPYDLFTDKDYSSSKVSHMFYDFGPKWNLEIDKDGKVWMPINAKLEFPLATWNFGLQYTFFIFGIGQKTYLPAPVYDSQGTLVLDSRFPVEVSEDRNTITIKPIVYPTKDDEGKDYTETYYPCVAQLQNGLATPLTPRVGGDIVLTRKSGASKSSASKNTNIGTSSKAPALKAIGEVPVPVQRPESRTILSTVKIKEFKRFTPETKYERGEEAFRRRANELVEKTFGIKLQ